MKDSKEGFKGGIQRRDSKEGFKGGIQREPWFPLHKENVRNHNKHNDVWKEEQEPRNRFITVLAKQVKNPCPE
jgi:hypothetical protein